MDISSTFWQNQVDLDCFMILIEKVDQKVHQNHATSWECNHDRIVIPVPEFVPFACSVSNGSALQHFLFKMDSVVVQSSTIDEPNCFAMKQSGPSF